MFEGTAGMFLWWNAEEILEQISEGTSWEVSDLMDWVILPVETLFFQSSNLW